MLLALFDWLWSAMLCALGAGIKNQNNFGWSFIGLPYGPSGLLLFAIPKPQPESAPAGWAFAAQTASPATIPEPSREGRSYGLSNNGYLKNRASRGQALGQGICLVFRNTIQMGASGRQYCGWYLSQPSGAAI